MKRRKLRDGHKRHQALIGEIVGAGISAAATLAAAGIGAAATKDAAKEQAEATLANAQQQANALKEQNQNATKLQEQQIEFQKEQNKEMRHAITTAQLNSQIGAATQNLNAMQQQNRITAKRGLINRSNSFYGGGIKPIDGGTVIPIQVDNTGEIYMITGNTHNQSHIAPDGKRKTGVGLKVPKRTNKSGETEIEAEGGELIKQYPNGDTAILSRHNIAGINPAKTVLQGGDFDTALIYQEMNKKERNNIGRKKAWNGYESGMLTSATPKVTVTPINIPKLQPLTMQPDRSSKSYTPVNNTWGNIGISAGIAGINALGGLGGALISYFGNKKAGNITADANTRAANIMSDAYNSLRTIDPNSIRLSDFAAQHALGTYRAPIINTNTQWTEAARMRDSLIKKSRTGSTSSAASFAKNLAANTAFLDYGNQVENKAEELRENIRQENVKMANNLALANAQMDNEQRSRYMGSKLELLKYNNDIANQRILGSAGAQAEGIKNTSNTWANIHSANAQGFANALTNSVNTGLAAFNNYQTYDNNLEMALLGADENAVKAFYKRKGLDPLTGRRIKRNNNNSVR